MILDDFQRARAAKSAERLGIGWLEVDLRQMQSMAHRLPHGLGKCFKSSLDEPIHFSGLVVGLADSSSVRSSSSSIMQYPLYGIRRQAKTNNGQVVAERAIPHQGYHPAACCFHKMRLH